MLQIPIRSSALAAVLACVCLPALWAESIDFTRPAYHALDGQPSATISAFGYELTLFADLGVSLPGWVRPYVDATLSHRTGYGIGVNTTVLNSFNAFDPEIEAFERLRIQSMPDLMLYGFTLSQLSREGFFPYSEKAEYRINDGAWQTVSANSSGAIYVQLGDPLAGVVTVDWKAASPERLLQWNDFSLASLDVAPFEGTDAKTPEPGTLGLLGGSLFIGSIVLRKLRRASRPAIR